MKLPNIRFSGIHLDRKTSGRAASDPVGHILTDKMPISVQEAYKQLRTNVLFSLPGSDCKVIGVTSAAPGDGKSTNAINLAISMAQIGKKVLLVDCDLRMPSVSAKLRIPGAPGLSDFIVGQARIEDVVWKVERFGFNVMPAGNIPPDATGLLEARQIESLFTAFRKIYDFVIVDLPPVNTVADAVILSKFIDGYLLVVRQKQTRHRAVEEMLKQLRIVDAKILGFVSTGSAVEMKRGSYYYQR